MAENIEFNALDSNSNAVMAVADTVRTTLGPKGLDKLLIDQAMNRHISNDGVTILLSLRAIHPVARMIVEIAERQEQKVGDGTTTAVVMAAEMIKEGKRLIRELGVHPTKVIEGIDGGIKYASELLEKNSRKISLEGPELEQVVKTSLSSKFDGKALSKLVVDVIRKIGKDGYFNDSYDFAKSLRVIRRTDVSDKIVDGIVLERKRLDPELPSKIEDAKILLLKMDLKPVKESWIKENSKYEEILTMEKDRVSKSKEIVESFLSVGANTLLIASPEIDQVIEDLLVLNNIFAVRISSDEIEQLSRYTNAKPIRNIEELKKQDVLGFAKMIYEDEENGMVIISEGAGKKIFSLIISGSTKETSLERWRASSDGINAAEAALNHGVVSGGGSAELHVIEQLKNLKLKGLEQVGVDVVSASLESIMRQILTNAGFNGLEKVMNAKAADNGFGIDIDSGELVNMWEKGIIDPVLVKTLAIESAGEISKSVLRIDRNLAAEDLNPQDVSETRR